MQNVGNIWDVYSHAERDSRNDTPHCRILRRKQRRNDRRTQLIHMAVEHFDESVSRFLGPCWPVPPTQVLKKVTKDPRDLVDSPESQNK